MSPSTVSGIRRPVQPDSPSARTSALACSYVIDAVQKVAEERGVCMPEVALAWVTARPGVSSTILGARSTDQLETNLRAAGLRLSPSETAALDAASDPHPDDYPYGELGVHQRDRTLPNGH